jgi:hypothetical protein
MQKYLWIGMEFNQRVVVPYVKIEERLSYDLKYQVIDYITALFGLPKAT